ncbi:hypothetical protein FHU23_000489 [Clostridium saccharobutylicum]|nr:hypothetical protein [Clostridium saccharobutylicum]MBA8982039.1 hypothetical protein [Clostridium saccharobutylicum]MBA9011770.1 hypothetical protein [Clostridium saccharobutylicum]NOV56617.1 hypothetical protein [Clostridium saccharobutylicum]NOV81674.1 hypothetical protein [Clostridium saccharobutylicum]
MSATIGNADSLPQVEAFAETQEKWLGKLYILRWKIC